MKINTQLKHYVETVILPKYQNLDLAHQKNHIIDVIRKSLMIAKDYDVNLDMVYTIAAFHDIGLTIDRDTHHLVGAKILLKDQFIQHFFNRDQIRIMQKAIEDHRGSSKTEPRSIYGKIVAEADRSDSMDKIIERCILYQLNDHVSFEEIYQEVYLHIQNKYGVNGYLKVWLENEYSAKMLNDIRCLLNNEELFKSHTKSIYDSLMLKQL